MIDSTSTGMRSVAHTPPLEEAAPDTVVEELRIGAADGDESSTFGQILGIAILDNDRVAVLDGIAQQLRLFSDDGSFIRTLARKGAGPGELSTAYGLMRGPNDQIWVPDQANGRMSVFHPDSGFLRSFAFNPFRRAFIWDGAMLSGGRIAARSITLDTARAPLLRIYDQQMVQLDSILLPPAPQIDPKNPPGMFYWEAPDGSASGYRQVPYYPQLQPVLDQTGNFWSGKTGDPSYSIVRWRPNGDTLLRLSTDRALLPVGAQERDSVVRQIGEEMRRFTSAPMDWSKIPQRKPAVERLFFAENGLFWSVISGPDALWQCPMRNIRCSRRG